LEIKELIEMKMNDEVTVTIKDSNGKTFSRDWKSTDDKRDAIRWTLESGDVPYYVDIANIVEITVK
jgi:hypothetical protein